MFDHWSDGGAQAHTIATPAVATTYTAVFREAASAGGLTATYFNNGDLTGATVTRVDGTIDFAWGTAAPAAGIGPDTFSVRWVGTVRPPTSGTFTFYTESDDGVRLWVDGRLLVSNWTDHGATENSAAITLTAGVEYQLRMELHENTGAAVARLLWSGPSVPKGVVPAAALSPRLSALINFQPAGAAVPGGYLPDVGAVFGLRGSNGERYGWDGDNAAQTRHRGSSLSLDQRYDTLVHLQKPANPDAVWEIVVPNGTYTVHLVAGDPAHIDSVYRLECRGRADSQRDTHGVGALARGHVDRDGHRRSVDGHERGRLLEQQALLHRDLRGLLGAT